MTGLLKSFCAGAALLAVSGCVTPGQDFLVIESDPTDAQLKFPDGLTCTTPCPVTLAEDLNVTVAKAGYISAEYFLPAGQTGRVILRLDLAAPTTEVEESDLPDL